MEMWDSYELPTIHASPAELYVPKAVEAPTEVEDVSALFERSLQISAADSEETTPEVQQIIPGPVAPSNIQTFLPPTVPATSILLSTTPSCGETVISNTSSENPQLPPVAGYLARTKYAPERRISEKTLEEVESCFETQETLNSPIISNSISKISRAESAIIYNDDNCICTPETEFEIRRNSRFRKIFDEEEAAGMRNEAGVVLKGKELEIVLARRVKREGDGMWKLCRQFLKYWGCGVDNFMG
ncbi:hypothetical protein RUND412_001380 [Rhizina undulata]